MEYKMTALKPCPFCGRFVEEPKLRWSDSRGLVVGIRCIWCGHAGIGFAVDNNASEYRISDVAEAVEKAVEQWNTRANEK